MEEIIKESDMLQDSKIDLNKIPRRLRRFFRNRELLVKELSKGAEGIPELKEIQKQKILAELKAKLEEAEREDLLTIAKHVSEQLKKEYAKQLFEASLKAYKGGELTKKDYEEIANSIYEQLKEEARKFETIEKEKKKKKETKIAKKIAKPLVTEVKKEELNIKDDEILELLGAKSGKKQQEEDEIFKELEKMSGA